MAAAIQRQTDQQELQCSLLALAAKAGLVLLGCVSLIRLSVAYQERMDRHGEISAVVSIETAKLETLQQRFDRVFSIGGEKRLISEQDQWIGPHRPFATQCANKSADSRSTSLITINYTITNTKNTI